MANFRPVVLFCIAFVAAVSAGSAIAQALAGTPPTTVVAKQGGVSVTLADIDAFAERIPPKDRAAFFDSPQRLENLISSLLLQRELAEQARTEGLDKDPKVAAQIVLASEDVLSKARMQKFKEELKKPDLAELAREDYTAHKERYLIPGRLEVKHILISTSDRTEEDARALAEKVLKEAQAAPDSFGDLVEKYSDDPSKKSNHGMMTDVTGGKYVPEFVSASKALTKPGELSPLVKTKFGFHIIKLVQKTDDRQREFNEAKGEIMARLSTEYVDKASTGFTDKLRNQPIDAVPEVVASLRARYGVVDTPASLDAKAEAAASKAAAAVLKK